MPFSFIDIEKKKTKIIGFLFVFIILFYFLTAYLLLLVLENTLFASSLDYYRSGRFIIPSFNHTAVAFAVAFIIGLIHWSISTSNLIEKISLAVGAVPVDEQDIYHQYLKNIVDEVSVAIGGRPIEARVISSASMNAFALEDFGGRAVIGVTEGLLTRLSRAQIEAVVGHEAGHIINGDCLATTVTCSLAELYEEASSKIAGGVKRVRGRGSIVVLLVYLVLIVMRFLSTFIRYFISRQREYRADATSVRLTRDPLSLAEALMLISKNWRGAGVEGERLQSIFIINPNFSKLDEGNGLFADMFSTHPPIKNRIGTLLGMAHLDEKALEENLKNFKRVPPVATEGSPELSIGASAEFETEDKELIEKKWFVFMDQQWLGPYFSGELKNIEGFKPDQWVRQDGNTKVGYAYEEKELKSLFLDGQEEEKYSCPHCKASLAEITYEGAPIYKCPYCQGAFVAYDKITRILIRQDKEFSDDIVRLAETVIKEKEKFAKGLQEAKLKNPWVINCPKCGSKYKMQRQFFVYSYPVEIDKCSFCGGIWFDKQELEVLQYIYENKENFFKDNSF